MLPKPHSTHQRTSLIGMGVLALALVFGIAIGVAGVLAESPEKQTASQSKKTSAQPADIAKKGSPKENLETLRDLLNRFKNTRWKYQEATRKKIEQEEALEDLKKRPGGGRFVGQFLHRQEIFRQQEQLHLTIQDREAYGMQALKTAEEIAQRAPAICKALTNWLKASQRSAESEEGEPANAARQKKLEEVKGFIQLLNRIADDPSQAEQILSHAFDKKSSPGPPEDQRPPFMGMRHKASGGGGGPWHGKSMEARIRALEYEQESLYRQWVRNENTLRALRKIQEERQDKSDTAQPPLAPRHGKWGREGARIPPDAENRENPEKDTLE
jgi:hypothetical protein